jgi:hypothetical protein
MYIYRGTGEESSVPAFKVFRESLKVLEYQSKPKAFKRLIEVFDDCQEQK